jgi:hypothetical protein
MTSYSVPIAKRTAPRWHPHPNLGAVKPPSDLLLHCLLFALLALLALALVAAAWGASAAGEYRVSQLDLSQFTTADDVPGALARDGYVARHELPFVAAAALLDGLAIVALVLAVTFGSVSVEFRVLLGATVGLVALASAVWHGLVLLVTAFFAL